MRIAIVINTSWNIWNFRMGLVNALLAAGHEVYAIAPPDDFSMKLVAAGCQFIPVQLDNKGSNPLRDLAYFRSLYRHYRQVWPQAVLHYTIKPNLYGTLAAKLLGIPAINNVSGLGTVFLRSGLSSRVAKQLYKLAFRFPYRVFFQNPDDRELFVTQKLVQRERTALVPGSGVDLQKFAFTPLPRNPTFRFLLVARLIGDKGIVEYAQAAQQLRSEGNTAQFGLLGFFEESPLGVSRATVQEWVAAGYIDYLGSAEDVRPFLAEADCVVLPSYREGVPRTLLEAAAMGRPLVATAVPGCREVVEKGKNGLLCEPRNAASLAASLRQMQELTLEERNGMGFRSRAMVEEKFSEQRVVQAYQKVLMQLGIMGVA